MFGKYGYTIQMSVNISDSDKKKAQMAEEAFEDLLSRLKLAMEHLNLIYVPFQKYENLNADELIKYRRVFRNYRDQIKTNFDRIFRQAFRAMTFLNEFSTDTVIGEMINSFLAEVKDVERHINILLELFDNLSSTEFRGHLIATVDSVRKQVNQLKQIINDRILEHISTNILAKNWMSDVADRYQQNVEEKVPLVVQLFKERQEALK